MSAALAHAPYPVALYRLAYSSDEAPRLPRVRTGKEKADRLLRLICRLHNVRREDVLSDRRSGGLVSARHHYIWALYRFTVWSMPQIGRLVGRDHTSVLHALVRLSNMRPHRPGYHALRPTSPSKSFFTADEDAKIVAMRQSGKSFGQIARALHRSDGACYTRWRRMTGAAA
jgi:hypothetical protein